ncbi:sarcosine oxidase subunit delta [Flavisphingomonas formosensis]|uniref:sarcosine oxidase subunit delta n=1 Tax=Flavisphingomonas formosensis TaxID=861534 RepID=UPI0012F97A9C|nr:sarcosine oxidase subunit delta [Sphingomonas formosensis]
MRIPCPYCGERDAHEFVYRGDAAPQRPDGAEANEAAFADYVYPRANVAGAMHEHWYHAQGCRTWIVVERDTRSHAIAGATLAREAKR